MATKQIQVETTGNSPLARMSRRRSVGLGAVLVVTAVLTTLLAMMIVSAFA